MALNCKDGEQLIGQECVWYNCVTQIPLMGSAKCGNSGTCEGEGNQAKCACNSELDELSGCMLCLDTSKSPIVSQGALGSCKDKACLAEGADTDCGGNGYCQAYDRESDTMKCQCKPAFTGDYCDTCNEHYVDEGTTKCGACEKGYLKEETSSDVYPYLTFFTCYRNECDTEESNALCTRNVSSGATPTCQRDGDVFVCKCPPNHDPKPDSFCKKCLPGFSLAPALTEYKQCVQSECWKEGMSKECTSEVLGKCLEPSGDQKSPICKCNSLVAALNPAIEETRFCGKCVASNMDPAKGCMCSKGYRLQKESNVYSCQRSSCISDEGIKALGRFECANLYEAAPFLDADLVFDYKAYETLFNNCACAGAGTCDKVSCTKCDTDAQDSAKGCAVCKDANLRFVNGGEGQTVFCVEDKCTTGTDQDCNGHGPCKVLEGNAVCSCGDTLLNPADKCATCLTEGHIFVSPPPEEEEEKNEMDIGDREPREDTGKPKPVCVPDTCTAKVDSKQMCNNKGQCYLYYKENSTTEVEARCECGELTQQCTACEKPAEYPFGTVCYAQDCGRAEIAGGEGQEATFEYCSNHGTCSNLSDTTLRCQCNQQFSGKHCDTCAEGYTNFGEGDTAKECLKCKPGYKPMSPDTEGTDALMCLKDNCPADGCNSEANPQNQCAIQGNEWKCVCAKGYIHEEFMKDGFCRACGKGYKKESVGNTTYCYPSTCTSEVFDPMDPMASPSDELECSLDAKMQDIVHGVCTKDLQSNTYSCQCNKRFTGDLCELCGYKDITGLPTVDENMLSKEQIDEDIALGATDKDKKNYQLKDICKCKPDYRFGDDGSGVQRCVANYCLASVLSCNNNPNELKDKEMEELKKRMECCGIKSGEFTNDPIARSDDFEVVVQSDVCQLKNGAYRCLNCGNYSIFSANYQCSRCIDQIAGRAGVKIGNKCYEDNCKKNCNEAGICTINGSGKSECKCIDTNLDNTTACSRCVRPLGAIKVDGFCMCDTEYFTIKDESVKSCAEGDKYELINTQKQPGVCVPRDCGVGGNCYSHGKCGCVDQTTSETVKYPITLSCIDCDDGYTMSSQCKDCDTGFRKGAIHKSDCLLDRCTAQSSKRLCNSMGTCNQEYNSTMDVMDNQTLVTKTFLTAGCSCSPNAQRLFKGFPDCETCLPGYKFRDGTTTCVLNKCLLLDEEGLPRPDFEPCDGAEKGTCSYERAYNQHRCRCKNGLYDADTACTDCKENVRVGYQVRDPNDECKCIASKNLLEHPMTLQCVVINCKQEGAAEDCNGLGKCVPGLEEFECSCNAGEDPKNYCATCLNPAENEEGIMEYYSYPQIVKEGEIEKEICYLNSCERTKLQDDPSQCNGRGACVQNVAQVAYICQCVTGYTSETQCKNCDEGYQVDPETRQCNKIPYKMPAAGYVGIVFAVLLVVGVVLGVIYYRWKSKKIAEENERKITVDRTKTAQQPITVVTI